jgi:hypothetical protein
MSPPQARGEEGIDNSKGVAMNRLARILFGWLLAPEEPKMQGTGPEFPGADAVIAQTSQDRIARDVAAIRELLEEDDEDDGDDGPDAE